MAQVMTSSSAFESLFHSLIVLSIKNFVVIVSLIFPLIYLSCYLLPIITPLDQSILLPDLESSSNIYTGLVEYKISFSYQREHRGDSSISGHVF